MIVAPVLSALHVLALGIGLGAVFMRGRYLLPFAAAAMARGLCLY
ncbi:MAG TPA: hypothetical protein VKB92_01155 [Myxococcales bacterium]|nr:hypothetical protein [Myxococcales bacterium]